MTQSFTETKLEEVDWEKIYEMEDVDIANDYFETEVTAILDELCPMKTTQFINNFKPWINRETRDKMEARDIAIEIARRTNSDEDWRLYRKLRNGH